MTQQQVFLWAPSLIVQWRASGPNDRSGCLPFGDQGRVSRTETANRQVCIQVYQHPPRSFMKGFLNYTCMQTIHVWCCPQSSFPTYITSTCRSGSTKSAAVNERTVAPASRIAPYLARRGCRIFSSRTLPSPLRRQRSYQDD